MTHELRTWPLLFDAVLSGKKTFEIRKGDRPYAVGDFLWLREWSPYSEKFLGRQCHVAVTYVMSGGTLGLDNGYVCMAISLRDEAAGGTQ